MSVERSMHKDRRPYSNEIVLIKTAFVFYKKLKCHSSALLRVLAEICYPEILSIANKYNVYCLDVSVGQVRRCVWQVFADSVMQAYSLF